MTLRNQICNVPTSAVFAQLASRVFNVPKFSGHRLQRTFFFHHELSLQQLFSGMTVVNVEVKPRSDAELGAHFACREWQESRRLFNDHNKIFVLRLPFHTFPVSSSLSCVLQKLHRNLFFSSRFTIAAVRPSHKFIAARVLSACTSFPLLSKCFTISFLRDAYRTFPTSRSLLSCFSSPTLMLWLRKLAVRVDLKHFSAFNF